MFKLNIILISILFCSSSSGQANLLNLSVEKDDPLFTTYAAPMSRSEYRIDQGYELKWYDPEKGIIFESKDGGSIGAAFRLNGAARFALKQYYKAPVISASYSDLVKFNYYPYRNIRVENIYAVYSSRIAVFDLKFFNEGNIEAVIDIFPYYLNSGAELVNAEFNKTGNTFFFEHEKVPDNWMVEHDIPVKSNLLSVFFIDQNPDDQGIYSVPQSGNFEGALSQFIADTSFDKKDQNNPSLLIYRKTIKINPGEQGSLRIIRGMNARETEWSNLLAECRRVVPSDLKILIDEDKMAYKLIPDLSFSKKDYQILYRSAFSLLRQCMMPPEGECSFNYYIFSREPKWGWGFGGQVFHESLSMLAYAFMDPAGAMNSQRVFIERQRENGYINYRTGPYLNETIEYNDQLTSSAPWFNYQNYEIFKITRDTLFLKEAYNSGKKFYNYYIEQRDSDADGLCEWGAHAELESVRDARVAVWDKVGWPSNFESIGLNSMLVKEANSLSLMANELGFQKEARQWMKDADRRASLVRNQMWDSATGFFYNIDKSDNDFSYKNRDDLKIKEIVGFLPLWAGVASKEQADRLMEHLTNAGEFWRRFGIPSLSADDEYYNPIGYWNGPVWIQWQYLLINGLIDYGYQDTAVKLIEKVLDGVIIQLKKDHCFWEFYSPDDKQAGWNKTYIWAGLTARMLIDLDYLETDEKNENK